MGELQLPRRMFAKGQEPMGEKVNAYHNVDYIKQLVEVLDPDELETLRAAGFRKVFDMPSTPTFSARFVLMLLSRQLEVKKKKEIWVLFAGKPVRFSLREFKIVTGLRCGPYPPKERCKKKDTMGALAPYYGTLFGMEDNVTVKRVIEILKNRVVTDREMRLRYAALVIVDGVILARSNIHPVNKEHTEMARDLEKFLAYPWGRRSFESMIHSIQARGKSELAYANPTIQGLVHALQLVVIEAAPAILEPRKKILGDDETDEETEMVPEEKTDVPFKLPYAREIDEKCEAEVETIIHPDFEFGEEENLEWDDEVVDPKVDNMVRLSNRGKLASTMFHGGSIMSTIPKPQKKQKVVEPNTGCVAKGKSVRTQESTSRTKKRRKDAESDRTGLSGNEAFLSDLIEAKITAGFENLRSELPTKDDVLAIVKASEENVIKSVLDWFRVHISTSEEGRTTYPTPHGQMPPQPKETNANFVQSSALNVSNQKDATLSTTDSNKTDNDGKSSSESEDASESEDDALAKKAVPAKQSEQSETGSSEDESESEHEEQAVEATPEETINAASASQVKRKVPEVDGHHEPGGSSALADANSGKPVDANTTGVVANAPTKRESKRARMETTLIDDRFLCSEKTKKTMGHPISDDAEDAATKEINLMLKVALDKLKNNTYLNLEGGVKITWRDVSDIMEKNKPITNKVMDALTMFGLSNPSLIENATPRTAQEYLDAKFVSQLSRLFPKFEKNENKEGFVFPKTLAEYLCSGDSSGLYPTFADAAFIYIPHHLSNNHWVGLCVDLAARKILVLDSNVNQVSDDSLKIELQPLAIMLPYLFKQASGPTALTQEFNFNPFSSERVAGVPQVSPVLYSGMVTVLLIKYHSLGCLPLLRDFDAKTMILEFKKLVAAFIGKYVQ